MDLFKQKRLEVLVKSQMSFLMTGECKINVFYMHRNGTYLNNRNVGLLS